MKRFVPFLLLLLIACRRDDPSPEQAALVLYADPLFCGFCGGWFVAVDTVLYRANVPQAFGPKTPVWIRFRKDESDGLKRMGNWIEIQSIRSR